MYSTLIVARMAPHDAGSVAGLFTDFDRTDMPARMGTRRRELFSFHGLYFHLQDFGGDIGADRIEDAKTHPLFTGISARLKAYIEPYDPATWRSPSDAMANRFYHWDGAGE